MHMARGVHETDYSALIAYMRKNGANSFTRLQRLLNLILKLETRQSSLH